MAQIILKGELDPELTSIGLKQGDIIEDATETGKVGCMQFSHRHGNWSYNCSVWPDNYDLYTSLK